jgi:hypothetical protein
MERKFLLALTVAVAVAVPVRADDSEEGPGRGVARISLLNGDVSVKRGDSGDLVAAALNSPLVVQDRVFTGPTSRTEIQFDWANMMRLSSNAEIRLAELEYKRYIIQVARGTVTFRVLRDQEADVEVSTPSVAVRPVKKGEYRITVVEDGTSEITVRSGEAEIFTTRGTERLRSGRTMYARGTAADPEYRVAAEIPEDEWDKWNERRDRDLERSRSYSYVSRDIYGAEDLDDHGRWIYVPSYGHVWSPRVAVGWAPYRYGRWSWIDWYGWSWISYDPWGWAPYHYGRWFYSAPYGWCWYPGRVYARHYWSPALVAFFGFGRGVGVGIGLGFGNVGWVPLAPYERFHRWWGPRYYGGYRNPTYIDRSVRVVNNVNITNIYRNARVNDGITGVDTDGFSRGRIGRSIRTNDAEVSRASVVEGQLPVVPQRESLRLADRNASGVTESRNDRFFTRRNVAQVDKVPFDEQRRGVETIARRTFGEDTGNRTLTAEQPVRGVERTGSATAETRGWRRIDEPVRGVGRGAVEQGSVERNASTTERDSGEWRRFGTPRTAESVGAESNRADRPGRFGEPATVRSFDQQQPQQQGTTPSRNSEDGGWRRFSDRTAGARDQPSSRTDTGRSESGIRGEARRSESPRYDSPRDESRSESRNFPSRSESPRTERRSERGSGEVRISPPIVRDRSNSFDGGMRSAPRSGGGMRGGDGGTMRGGGGGMRGGDASPSRSSGGDGGGRSAGGESRGGRGGGR